jgi:hypothetical protein
MCEFSFFFSPALGRRDRLLRDGFFNIFSPKELFPTPNEMRVFLLLYMSLLSIVNNIDIEPIIIKKT